MVGLVQHIFVFCQSQKIHISVGDYDNGSVRKGRKNQFKIVVGSLALANRRKQKANWFQSATFIMRY